VIITQYGTMPFEEVEVKQVSPGFSLYLTTAAGQKFRIDESTGGGLTVSHENALVLRPVSFQTVSVDAQ
jgi:hypothetical protein